VRCFTRTALAADLSRRSYASPLLAEITWVILLCYYRDDRVTRLGRGGRSNAG